MKILSASPYYASTALTLVRIVVGVFIAIHGSEIFNPEKMKMYTGWMFERELPLASILAYIGKGCQLVGGIFLSLGFLTRLASFALILTMSFITFGIGNGKFWMEDQHPFLFVMFALLFLFLGGGDFSLDKKLFSKDIR